MLIVMLPHADSDADTDTDSGTDAPGIIHFEFSRWLCMVDLTSAFSYSAIPATPSCICLPAVSDKEHST